MNKDLKKLIRALEKQGYVVNYTSDGHPMVFTADGAFITKMSITPSERRGWHNALARLRRHGFIWPVKK